MRANALFIRAQKLHGGVALAVERSVILHVVRSCAANIPSNALDERQPIGDRAVPLALVELLHGNDLAHIFESALRNIRVILLDKLVIFSFRRGIALRNGRQYSAELIRIERCGILLACTRIQHVARLHFAAEPDVVRQYVRRNVFELDLHIARNDAGILERDTRKIRQRVSICIVRHGICVIARLTPYNFVIQSVIAETALTHIQFARIARFERQYDRTPVAVAAFRHAYLAAAYLSSARTAAVAAASVSVAVAVAVTAARNFVNVENSVDYFVCVKRITCRCVVFRVLLAVRIDFDSERVGLFSDIGYSRIVFADYLVALRYLIRRAETCVAVIIVMLRAVVLPFMRRGLYRYGAFRYLEFAVFPSNIVVCSNGAFLVLDQNLQSVFRSAEISDLRFRIDEHGCGLTVGKRSRRYLESRRGQKFSVIHLARARRSYRDLARRNGKRAVNKIDLVIFRDVVVCRIGNSYDKFIGDSRDSVRKRRIRHYRILLVASQTVAAYRQHVASVRFPVVLPNVGRRRDCYFPQRHGQFAELVFKLITARHIVSSAHDFYGHGVIRAARVGPPVAEFHIKSMPARYFALGHGIRILFFFQRRSVVNFAVAFRRYFYLYCFYRERSYTVRRGARRRLVIVSNVFGSAFDGDRRVVFHRACERDRSRSRYLARMIGNKRIVVYARSSANERCAVEIFFGAARRIVYYDRLYFERAVLVLYFVIIARIRAVASDRNVKLVLDRAYAPVGVSDNVGNFRNRTRAVHCARIGDIFG